MKFFKYIVIATLTIFAASAVATSVQARPPTFMVAEKGKYKKQNYSLDKAVTKLRKHQRGRVLSADTVQGSNRSEHRIRMLSPDGRVRTYRVDPRSGADID